MAWTDDDLDAIYNRTSGKCHLCHKKLARFNYADYGARGAWEVEHSVPKASGGTDHLNNLFPACITCNRSKNAGSTRSSRAANGRSRAPLNRKARRAAKTGSALVGAGLGAFVGSAFGPLGTLVCGALGAHLGHMDDPDR